MIVGVGTDLCALARIEAALASSGDRFAHKVLGPAELQVFEQRRALLAARGVSYLATRFAAKEALAKALGLGMRAPMSWQACEVLNDAQGKPSVHLHGDLATWMAAQGWRAHVSLSDEHDHAQAFVVVEQV
jgi:holo-[acyl-carrier protein] synthase